MTFLLRLLLRTVALTTALVLASCHFERADGGSQESPSASLGKRHPALVVQSTKGAGCRAKAPHPRDPAGVPVPERGRVATGRRGLLAEAAPAAARRAIGVRVTRRIPRMGSDEPPVRGEPA